MLKIIICSRSWLSNLRTMTKFDGYDEWRKKESLYLSDLVQQRLNDLQNPTNCDDAKYIKCASEDKNCGWGCHVHYITECLGDAYGYGRTLIFNSSKFLYTTNGLNEIIEPLSDTCTESPMNASQTTERGKEEN